VTTDATPREFKELPLGLLDDPALPSRSEMDETAMDELVSSIRANGLLQPIIVARAGDRFEVIAGHRRRIACGRAGLVTAPCIIYASKDAAHMAIQYAENRFREELSPTDEALLFAELLERDCGGDVDKLCEKLGEKRAYVEGRLLLLRDEHIFAALQAGEITKIGIAQQLMKITDPHQRRRYLDAAIRGGATAAVVSGWVQEWKAMDPYTRSQAPTDAPAAAPGAVPQMDYFRCAVCDGTDNVHLMVPINVHQHCKLAILDKLLATYKGVE
jgi:ParB family chromosome partitioning protein